jgi:acyl-CoA synthetase (AMP-forming)/AMP-acid ligase II/acetyltransferase-like isoleucine patch superfamily enzyme/acyl carrier protein
VILTHANDDAGGEFLRLIFPGENDTILTYRELVAEAGRWTTFYDRAGLNAGDRVIVALEHSVDLYAAYLGALLGGQTPTMFAFPSPKFSEQEYFRTIDALLTQAQGRIFVTYTALARKLEGEGMLGTAAVATPADIADIPVVEPTLRPSDADRPAFLQYSSGTTGIKKGVTVSHRALLWQIDAYCAAIGAGPDDRIVSWLPLYHDMGLVACFFLPLLRKIPLVAMSPFDWVRRPAMWAEAVSTHQGTLSWLPNFAFNLVAANVRPEDVGEYDLSSLRGVVNCSEPILASTFDSFLTKLAPAGMTAEKLAASYAMAENTFAVTSGGFGIQLVVDHVERDTFDRDARAVPAAQQEGGRRFVSSGRALPETTIEIIDDEGRSVPDRTVGEITVASPSLMSGYDANAEATAAVLANGRYRTGDLGYLADGSLFITGRKQDLVIIGGRNIYPQDVETVVNDVIGVVPGRVVAFGVPRLGLGTEGLVVLAETQETDPQRVEAIRSSVREAIITRADVVPEDVRIVRHRTLLKSSAGKLARNENRRRYLEEDGPPEPGPSLDERGTGDVLAAVRAVVARIVGSTPADDASLLSSGAIDSFGLPELISGVEDAFGIVVPIDMTDIERLDTIALIAATASEIMASDTPRLPGSDSGDSAPSKPPMTYDESPRTPKRALGFWSIYYRSLFRLKRITCGPGLSVHGRLVLQLDGDTENVVIGRNVTLMPGAHLKNREAGRIVLHDNVKLDTTARLVAANDALIEIGERCTLGPGTIVNAGRDVLIGRGTLTAPYCVLNASDHGIARATPIIDQPFEHAAITIGEDVWLGAGVLVAKGSRIGAGAVVSAGAIVSGEVPPYVVAQGRPARPIKRRR